MHPRVLLALALAFPALLLPVAQPDQLRLVSVRKIWDQAPYNSFTDLVHFRGRWYCAFREGKAHVSPDGALRILTSPDGKAWKSAARIMSSSADLRDPKLSVTPQNRLMLVAAAATPQAAAIRHQTLVWFSSQGSRWSKPVKIGDPNVWLWRVTWHDGIAYGVGYSTVADRTQRFARLYSSQDGVHFHTLVDRLYDRDSPSEATIMFLHDGTAVCLLRCDAKTSHAKLGTARPPYRNWTWKDLGVSIGGPNLAQLPDGSVVAGGRRQGEQRRTVLWMVDVPAGKLTELLTLPSGGDNSYPGMVFHNGLLWVSYYSSHEGKPSIYLAQVKLSGPGQSHE